jgi:hypothetical protein
MSTAYPRIEWFELDVSGLQWEELPCPPAAYTFEWAPVESQGSLLVSCVGDYYLGFERPVGTATRVNFFNYKRLQTNCVPVSGSFGAIPDQVAVVGANYDPTTGAASFVATLLPDDRRQFVRADANDDGWIDLADAVHILSYLFRGEDLAGEPDAADANDDGAIDLGDAVSVLSYLFSDTSDAMIQAPYWAVVLPSTKGMDPTSDGL